MRSKEVFKEVLGFVKGIGEVFVVFLTAVLWGILIDMLACLF